MDPISPGRPHQSSTSAAESSAPGGTNTTDAKKPPVPDPLAELQLMLVRIQEAIADYIQAGVDGVRVTVRTALLRLLLITALVICGAVVASVGLVFLLVGSSAGLAQALGAPIWVGNLCIGAVAVVLPLLVSRIQLQRQRLKWLKRAEAKYAARNARRAA